MSESLPAWLITLSLLGALVCAISGRMNPWIRRSAWGLGYGGGFLIAMEALFRLRSGIVLRLSLGGWAPPWGLEASLDSARAGALAAAFLSMGLSHAWREMSSQDEAGPKAGITAALRLVLMAGLAGILVLDDALGRFGAAQLAIVAEAGLLSRSGALRSGFSHLMRCSAGSALFLAGTGLMFARTGAFHLEGWAARLSSDGPVLHAPEALALLLAGCALWAGPWAPHEEAPTGPLTVTPESAWRSRLFLWMALDLMIRVFHRPVVSSGRMMMGLTAVSLVAAVGLLVFVWNERDRNRTTGFLDAAALALLPTVAFFKPHLFLLAAAAQAWALILLAPVEPDQTKEGREPASSHFWAGVGVIAAALTLACVPPTLGFLAVRSWDHLFARTPVLVGVLAAGLAVLGLSAIRAGFVNGARRAGESEVWRALLILGALGGGLLPLLI